MEQQSQYQPRPPWTPPASLAEAQDLYHDLLAKKQLIEAQLGDDLPRRHPDGTYYTPAQHDRWRHDAKLAKVHTEDDLRRVKDWIRVQREAIIPTATQGEKLRRLRYLAHNVVNAWETDGQDIALMREPIDALARELDTHGNPEP